MPVRRGILVFSYLLRQDVIDLKLLGTAFGLILGQPTRSDLGDCALLPATIDVDMRLRRRNIFDDVVWLDSFFRLLLFRLEHDFSEGIFVFLF